MISVIIPYHNAEGWIRRCANSLHAQSGDFEFVFVDDHSEDAGPDILKRYNDNRFVLRKNRRARGVSGARNTGLDEAKGEWITFLDADDEMVPDAYTIFCRMSRLDATANIIQANHLRHYDEISKTALKYWNPKGIYTFDKMPEQWFMVWNKLLRASFIGETRFVEGMQYGEDEIFNLDLLAKDERIFHTHAKTVTTIRHFNNKESLAHTIDREKVMRQARELEEYLLRTENPRAKMAAMMLLADHWKSPTYIGAFGGKW